ncbi:phage integrase family protein [Caballeronia ptereochthonis]|uniref:Phage integrase family protein n=1 Tax=Caballeronia ptereochthonis TaxID=1777144 RepID=A0A158DY81_9BURK|nr:phage integrase family protein [Caballeronia ptereochthonis]
MRLKKMKRQATSSRFGAYLVYGAKIETLSKRPRWIVRIVEESRVCSAHQQAPPGHVRSSPSPEQVHLRRRRGARRAWLVRRPGRTRGSHPSARRSPGRGHARAGRVRPHPAPIGCLCRESPSRGPGRRLRTERAPALIAAEQASPVVPLERLRVPHEPDGSWEQFRAPRDACLLNASNDYDAIQSWLSSHGSGATQRAYRERRNA